MGNRSKKRKRGPHAGKTSSASSGGTSIKPAKRPAWKNILQALVIVIAVWWVFSPAFHGGWLMDDNTYITQNPLLHDPYGLWSIWLQPGSFVEYYPIEATVQWFQ